MRHSACKATPSSPSTQDAHDSLIEHMPAFTSLHDWAEFSDLLERLDKEFSHTPAAPRLHLVEKPGSSGSCPGE